MARPLLTWIDLPYDQKWRLHQRNHTLSRHHNTRHNKLASKLLLNLFHSKNASSASVLYSFILFILALAKSKSQSDIATATGIQHLYTSLMCSSICDSLSSWKRTESGWWSVDKQSLKQLHHTQNGFYPIRMYSYKPKWPHSVVRIRVCLYMCVFVPAEGRGLLVDQWVCDLYAGSDQTKPFKSSGNTH